MLKSEDAQATVPSGLALIESARRLVPRFVERDAQAGTERRVPEVSISEIKGAGLFKALQPKRWGDSS